MDWNSSLDDIIKSKPRSAPSRSAPSRGRRPDGRRLDGRRLYVPVYSSSPRLSLSTSQLPNRLEHQRRQRRREPREPSYSNNRNDGLLITKPVRGPVNPASIVITTTVDHSPKKADRLPQPSETKNVKSSSPAPLDRQPSPSPPPSSPPAEQHHNDTSDLQRRIHDQNEHILELQRLLNEPVPPPPLSFLADHPASCVVLFTNLDPAATSSGIRVRKATTMHFFLKHSSLFLLFWVTGSLYCIWTCDPLPSDRRPCGGGIPGP